MAMEIIDAARSMNLLEMKQETIMEETVRGRSPSPKAITNTATTTPPVKSESATPMEDAKGESASEAQSVKDEENEEEDKKEEEEEKVEQPEEQKSKRRGNKKPPRMAPLFDSLPDKTEEATKSFTILKDCTYMPKWLGESGQEDDAMACECQSQFDGSTNLACGIDSDCINRMTSMECVNDDATCGGSCRNQRFQNREYADVSVIQTEKKGYGLRTNQDLTPGTFIFEYIGEVIDEMQFRKRQQKYADQDIKHFYFMSLKSSEYIDATKKGCLARFCNHSCNPNCMVEKWVVGGKMRMGIFAKVKIMAGEELTFDYNVDRYGADAQTCYCGEMNCVGFIGGRTQTGGETKLAHLYQDALGIDEEDAWKSATSRRKKKKKSGDDDDEEYIDRNKLPELTKADAKTVMTGLFQCRERWIAVCLLTRIKKHNDQNLDIQLMRLHGYTTVDSVLKRWSGDSEVVTAALEVLRKWPAITKNKINSSKIEPTIQMLASHEDENVKKLAEELLEHWSTLQVGYRIPRRVPPPKVETPRSIPSEQPSPQQPATPEPPKGPKLDSRKPFKPRPKQPQQFRNKSPADSRGITKSRYPRLNLRPIQLAMALPGGWAAIETEDRRDIVYYNIKTDTHTKELPIPYTNDNSLPPFVGPLELKQCAEQYKRQRIIDGTMAKVKAEEEQRRKEAEAKQNAPPPPPPPLASEKKPVKRPYDHEAAKRQLTKAFAKVVPNLVSRYEKHIGGREATKEHSKKIVQILVEKDTRDGREVRSFDLSDEKKKKIKVFVNEYMCKVVRHVKKVEARRRASSQTDTASPVQLPPSIGTSPNDTSPKEAAGSSPEGPSPLSEETKATSTSPSLGTPAAANLDKILAAAVDTNSNASPDRKRKFWDAPKAEQRTPSPKRKADDMLDSAEKLNNNESRPAKRRSPVARN